MMHIYLVFKFLVLGIVTHFSLKNRKAVRSNVGLNQATTIGVLYSYESPAKHEVVQRFIRDLKNLDKQVSVVCYTTGKDRGTSNLRYTFGHQAVTILGKIANDRIKKFVTTPFDYLFHLDLNTNSVLDAMVAQHQAKCRVGHFDAARRNLFEVMVKVSRTQPIEDIKRLAGQMLHYTECMEG